jgi:hypothetical protein
MSTNVPSSSNKKLERFKVTPTEHFEDRTPKNRYLMPILASYL